MKLLASLLLLAGSVHAATFTVDTTQPGNDALLRACTAAPGDCSFHGALDRSNALADADVVNFDIPASDDSGCVAATGVCRVLLPSTGCGNFADAYVVTSPLVLDGLTQPGASANTLPADGNGLDLQVKIELVRTGYCRTGLRFQKSATVRGVAVAQIGPVGNQTLPFLNFAGRDSEEIYRVESSLIGGRANGTVLSGDETLFNPIRVSDCFQCLGNWRNEAHIGGELPAQRNWFVSGAPAILVSASSDSPLPIGTEATIRGNLFGTTRGGNATGFEPTTVNGWINVELGNDGFVHVGGANAAARNVFATSVYPAIAHPPMGFPSTFGPATIRVQGNYFGLGADGVTPLAVRNAMYDYLSHTVSLARASIENNRFVSLYSTYLIESRGANTVLGNEFIGNIAYAMVEDPSRAQYGRLNDAGDADQHPTSGAMQNWPEISAFSVTGDQLTLSYRVDTLPANATYPLTVEFFRAQTNNATRLLGRDTYTAAEATTVKTVVFALPPGHGLDAESMIIGIANQSAGSGVSSFSWAPLLLSFFGNTPANINVPATISVRVQSPGPFRPRGRVEINDHVGNPLANKCIATLAPVAGSPYRAEGSCQITWQQAGNRTLTATYLDLHESFHSSSGNTPTATRPMEIQAAPAELLCDGFEDNLTGCARHGIRN